MVLWFKLGGGSAVNSPWSTDSYAQYTECMKIQKKTHVLVCAGNEA